MDILKKFSKKKVFVIGACIVVLALIPLFIVTLKIPAAHHVSTRSHSVSLVGLSLASHSALLNTPIATPSSTVTPAPVYSGYCLHVPILMYHHTAPQSVAIARGQTSLNVDNGVLDQQMEYIATHGFTTYSADEIVNALRNNSPLAGKPIVVTLDDAYDDNYLYAFPIFKKYNIKFTLMVPTGLLGVNTPGNSYFTWSQLKEMLGSGLGSVSNHTWSHASMGSSNEKDEFEITTSQKEFQDMLGYVPDTFTYPYGTGLYTRVMALLQQHRFIGAFSTISGQIQCDSFIMSLHRTRVGNAPLTEYGIY